MVEKKKPEFKCGNCATEIITANGNDNSWRLSAVIPDTGVVVDVTISVPSDYVLPGLLRERFDTSTKRALVAAMQRVEEAAGNVAVVLRKR